MQMHMFDIVNIFVILNFGGERERNSWFVIQKTNKYGFKFAEVRISV